MAADDLDPPALLSPLRTGLKLVRVLQRWSEGPDRASIYRDHYEEWVAELAQALRAHAGDVEALAERLDAFEQDRERVLVLGNLGFEAWREAVDRRRAMLGDAAVAVVVSELPADRLSRVERTVRMLDPADLDTLLRVENVTVEPIVVVRGAEMGPDRAAFARYVKLMDGHLGGAPLVASGCVRAWGSILHATVFEPPDDLPATEDERRELALREGELLHNELMRRCGAEVTPLGELVLQFMGRST